MEEVNGSHKQMKAIESDSKGLIGIMTNTIRIARLKRLFTAARVVRDSNRDKVRYFIHDAKTLQ